MFSSIGLPELILVVVVVVLVMFFVRARDTRGKS